MRRALGGAPGVRVVVTGMGQTAAARAAAEWVPRVRAVIVCGVAGGTGGAAGAGDVVVASALLVDGAVRNGLLVPRVAGTVVGPVASTAAVVDSAAARAAQRDAGALAVETEAAAWADACAARSVPLTVVRVVLDTPDHPLGAAALMLRDGDVRPHAGALLAAALHPRSWPSLLTLGRLASTAEASLARVVAVAAGRGPSH